MGYETCFPKGFNASTWFNHHFFWDIQSTLTNLWNFMVIDHQHWGYYSNHGLCHEKFSFHRGPLCTELDCTREFGSPWISPLKKKSWRNPVWVYIPLFFDCWWLLSFFLCPVTSPLHSPFQTRPHMICLVIYMASPYTPWCYDTPILLLVVDYIPSFQ